MTNNIIKIKKICLAIMTLLFLIYLPSVKAEAINFSVTPMFPDNQIGGGKSYFDLEMNPGTNQVLSITLANNSDKTIILKTEVAPATTNKNGLVEYMPNDSKPDKSLKFNMKELVKLPKEISISAHTSKKIQVNVKMPEEAFKGIISGGITFKQKKFTNEKNAGVSLNSEFQSVVALLLRQTTDVVTPDLKLSSVVVNQDESVQKNILEVLLQNSQPTYINQMIVQAKISHNNNTNINTTFESGVMQMAPNSNFALPINLSNLRNSQGFVKSGEYNIELTVYSQKNPDGKYKLNNDTFVYRWIFKKNFVIKQSKISPIFVINGIENNSKNPIKVILIIGFTVIFILGISGYFWMRKEGKIR